MSEAEQDPREERGLSLSSLLKFYWPLAVSWLFMSMETPLAISILSRMRDEVENTAVFLPMMAISLFIEGPVIDLLATATTFGRSRTSYRRLRSFSLWLMIWCTVIHSLVALTPIYGWVTGNWLGLRPELMDSLRPALIWMIPWSAFIGWRRFRQGILIRSGETRPIGIGTVIRAATIFGVGLALSYGPLPGIQVIAIALSTSVAIEAAFIHFASSRTVRTQLPETTPEELQTGYLSTRFLLLFHVPLALTTMLHLSSSQLAAKTLSMTQDAVLTMAAWQTASSLVFLHRALTFALPEMVISLATDTRKEQILGRFCVGIGAVLSGIMLLLWGTGASRWIMLGPLGTTPQVAEMAQLSYLACAILPLLTAYGAYYRGLLTAGRLTRFRLVAMGISTASFFLSLEVLVRVLKQGILVPSISLVIMAGTEMAVQAFFLRRSRRHSDDSAPKDKPQVLAAEPVSLAE